MKSKIIYIAILGLSLASFNLTAQVTEQEKSLKTVDTTSTNGWTKSGIFSLGFGQVALSNWAGGGVNSLSLNGLLNLSANYRDDKYYWNNSATLSFGIINQDKSEFWVKNDDKIDLASKLGKFWTKKAAFAAMLNFRTQFAPGYESPDQLNLISRFAAPAYNILGIGIDLKPKSYFSVFAAPLTVKTTIVADQNLADAGSFGVEEAEYNTAGDLINKGSNIRNEIGGYVRFDFAKDLSQWISLGSSLDLFSNYANNPQNIDVNWEVLLSIKAGKYITTTISTQLLYDDDIDIAIDENNDGVTDKVGPRLQFKEVLGVGMSVKF